jgi:DNA polymerase-4
VSEAPRFVLHVDVDQFIAAVEVLRRPELRGKPVVVGGAGDPTRRGVVATASYEARRFGIESGMPLRTAARRCPAAVFLPTDLPTYRAASEQFMATLRAFPGVLEVAGWDEAFLEVFTSDPEDVAIGIRRAVRRETGLSCSVGIGDNKLRAKTASAFAKPGGVFRLTASEWWTVMGDRPPSSLWGVGRKTARRLAELGITTVAALSEADEGVLAERFGPNIGPWLRRLAHGDDHSPVVAERGPARSRGREETFQEDLRDPEEIRREISRLAEQVAADLREDARPARRVVVKVRFSPFSTHSHGVPLEEPSAEPEVVREAALAALDRFTLDRPVRLLGVRAELGPSVAYRKSLDNG